VPQWRAASRRRATIMCCCLDADLQGLTRADLDALIAPVAAGAAAVSISLRRKQPRAPTACSGSTSSRASASCRGGSSRAVLAQPSRLPRFGVEVLMNRAIIAERLPIAVADWRGVTQARKAEKLGWWRGQIAEARMVLEIARAVYPLAAIGQTWRLMRLRVPWATPRVPRLATLARLLGMRP
jgi:hypothetical protein